MNIFQLISDDLSKVQSLLERNYKIKAGHLNEFVNMDFNDMDMQLRPGIVILSNRLFGPVTPKTIALAGVLQFIYLASQVHLRVKESGSGSGKDRQGDSRFKYQFPVLVGDYLYGKFFTTLCDAGIVYYLDKLARLICTINKGGVLNSKSINLDSMDQEQHLDIVRRESAEIFACSALLGADLAGANEDAKNKLYEFGLNIGMAYGLLERGTSADKVIYYLNEAEIILAQMPPRQETGCFSNLLTLLAKKNNTLCNMVV